MAGTCGADRDEAIATDATSRDFARVVGELSSHVIEAVRASGGEPVLVENGLCAGSAISILSSCDGLILLGGGDVDPATYGCFERDPSVDLVDAEQDRTEIALFRSGHHQAIETLGRDPTVVGARSDGEIEAIEGAEWTVLGVQCHPENGYAPPGTPDLLFCDLVQRSTRYRDTVLSSGAR